MNWLTPELWAKRIAEELSMPTLNEVFDHPDKWVVTGIRNGRLVVSEYVPYWGA